MRYLDTSAAMKILVEEPESAALKQLLNDSSLIVSSMLLHTELHCAAHRRAEIPQQLVNAVLDAVELVSIDDSQLRTAATAAWGLRSADAIHLAVALQLGAREIIAYDTELCRAAEGAGLRPLSPGLTLPK
ncbi:MAG: type II toxin-antitoxin system VapC family toxin [Propionibacteriaceae bacterium]|nr:type II toxin-antitoxin system VapC family toxin [Propionibacteriaceae bacterium]